MQDFHGLPTSTESEKTPTKRRSYILRHAPKEWGGCWEYAPRAPRSKQQTHMHSTSRSKRSPAQQIKAITSPAQPRKAEQKFSQAKPSMRASNTKHTRPKTQSMRLAYHFNSFRVGCVHTSCRALHLRSTVCLYLIIVRSPLFTNLFLTMPEEGWKKSSVEGWNDIPHVLKNAQLYKWALSNRFVNSDEFYQWLRNEISRHSTDTQQALNSTHSHCEKLDVWGF